VNIGSQVWARIKSEKEGNLRKSKIIPVHNNEEAMKMYGGVKV
jgi:hypothetical protein